LQAPIAEGDVVASLRVEMGSMPPFEVPLEAAEAVGEAGVLDRLGNGLAGLFT
jgi:hypothetical protein